VPARIVSESRLIPPVGSFEFGPTARRFSEDAALVWRLALRRIASPLFLPRFDLWLLTIFENVNLLTGGGDFRFRLHT